MTARQGCAALVAFALAAGFAFATDDAALSAAEAAYGDRAEPARARAALEGFEAVAAADPAAYEARWRGARAAYFLGTYTLEDAPDSERIAVYERGMRLAEQAIALEPDRVEGYFWHGVLVGVYGEARGIFKSLGLAPTVIDRMETALRIDPAFEGHGADRVLGRAYFKLPWFKGGDDAKAVEHLERSLAGTPTNALTRLYLAEAYRAVGRRADAVAQLREVVAMTPDPRWTAENPAIVRRARELLRKWE